VQPTVSESEFSYRAAIGLRYDINSTVFVRASVGKFFIDYDRATSDSHNLVTQLDFGFKFD
jgi:outer membrane protein W